MTSVVVAKKDLKDAIRSKSLWVISLLFILLMGGVAFLYLRFPEIRTGVTGDMELARGLITFLSAPIGLFIPIIALLLSYKSVSGEVESGSIKLLLSLPHSRLNVVLGKLLGRSSVLTIAIVVGFVVASAVVVATRPAAATLNYGIFVLLTILFGLSYVSIGVMISSLTKSSSKAAAGIFGVYLLFNFLWTLIPIGINYLLTSTLLPERDPTWFEMFNRLSPNGAFDGVLRALRRPEDLITSLTTPPRVGDPIYLAPWVAVLILLGWVLLGLVVGNLRFSRMDL